MTRTAFRPDGRRNHPLDGQGEKDTAIDPATVAVVDAEDEARQAESRIYLAYALLRFEQRMTTLTRWLAVVIFAAAGLVITVLNALID